MIHAVARPAFRRRIARVVGLAVGASAVVLGVPAWAQSGKPGATSASAAITGLAQFDTDLDRGGSFRWNGVLVSAKVARQFTDSLEVGASVRYDYQDWHFDAPTAFAGGAPWEQLHAPSLGLDFDFTVKPGLSLGVTPTVGWSYESGADAGDAVNWGAIFSATRVFSTDLVVGVGAGVFRQIDETQVFPFLIVSWQISDRLRLTNPFAAGPAGGAGLELAYALSDRWEIAGGGSYRSYRFRLKDEGPNANGIGENRFFPVFARMSWKLAPATKLDLYAAALVGGDLTLMDRGGNDVATDDYQTAPAIGLTLAHRF